MINSFPDRSDALSALFLAPQHGVQAQETLQAQISTAFLPMSTVQQTDEPILASGIAVTIRMASGLYGEGQLNILATAPFPGDRTRSEVASVIN